MIGVALSNLADIAASLSGDFHTMHLNMQGIEFDTMHRKVLKKYYEQSADDYDSWAEAALMFEDCMNIETTNDAAKRIEWQSFNGPVTREIAIERVNLIIQAYMEAAVSLFQSLNTKIDCAKCIGVANALQTRIEYWSKELNYFNARRV